ncbi:excalibur calcium-binding domain-containing protein [Arenibacter sp. ARW7G5Y1]|uniref:excalibur calcium-binding domain-containing protein n=1 Tax=Arenibacter sp. ARW7G5Y1 TaxID=2135619 RepID=UPI000D760051|nr:excalibur calcium-binding domain-containing protein [Arenibacter sp. ARW7G5Y1]PXX26317.1 excalibur calcium-binding domain-containing protein [Arenibacter sp. ARW7G5Y1]
MSYRKGYFKKDGTYVQGHFVSKGRSNKIFKRNNKKGCLGIFLIILAALTGLSCNSESTCESKKYSDFATQAEAQSTFETDKDCYSNLDRDNDNIACEN